MFEKICCNKRYNSFSLTKITLSFSPVLQPIKENTTQGDFKIIASHLCDFFNQNVVEFEAAIVSTFKEKVKITTKISLEKQAKAYKSYLLITNNNARCKC